MFERTCSCRKDKSCEHYNLEKLCPKLCKEWDYDKNDKNPNCFTPKSYQKAFWICNDLEKNFCGCHKWDAKIYHRTDGSGCPYCNGKKICPHNNLLALYPDLCKEWNYEKNVLPPEKYTAHSNVKVSWICSLNTCGCHIWDSIISSRTRSIKSGCPYCNQSKICDHYNLLALYPDLCKEWDYEKNTINPKDVAPGCNKKVFWICSLNPCGCHKWETDISSRALAKQNSCPYCNNRKVCPHDNLLISHSKLCEEWDYEKNKIFPENCSHACEKKVWWKCQKGHSWECMIGSRTRKNPSGCPTCCDVGYSKKQLDWLDKISKKYKLPIRNVLSPNGEYKVIFENNNFYLDGYVVVNDKKIAFEFDGCFWHGCENCYESTNINKVSGKTFGKLQSQTKKKRLLLEQKGYVVITIKECEYDKNKNFCDYDDILL